MNKKVKSIIIVSLVAVALLVGYKAFIEEKPVEGDKVITINIIAEDQEINKSYELPTYTNYLMELLEENQEKIVLEFEDSSFGKYITGLEGYTANPNNEFWSITVNGEMALVGASEIVLNDGDVIELVLTGF